MTRFTTSTIGHGDVADLRLGFTAYIANPSRDPAFHDRSVWPAILQTLSDLKAHPWCERLSFVRSTMDGADLPRPFDPDALARQIRDGARRGPLFGVQVHDGAELPEHSFDFQVISNPGSHPRASYVRVLLPIEAGASELERISERLGSTLPIWSGTGGYVFIYRRSEQRVAFDQIWAWARRFWGPGISHPPTETWDTAKGLAGINWITLLGDAFLSAHLPDLTLEEGTVSGVDARRCADAWLLRAGPEPRLGDVHAFERMPELSAVSRRVQPAFVQKPSALPGRFAEESATRAWLCRFSDPSGWREPQLG